MAEPGDASGKDAPEPEQHISDEARRVVAEYAEALRATISKLRQGEHQSKEAASVAAP
jgi:hypothetical protein